MKCVLKQKSIQCTGNQKILKRRMIDDNRWDIHKDRAIYIRRKYKIKLQAKKNSIEFFYFLDHFGNLNLPTMLTEVMT